jgi:hypothetical protein
MVIDVDQCAGHQWVYSAHRQKKRRERRWAMKRERSGAVPAARAREGALAGWSDRDKPPHGLKKQKIVSEHQALDAEAHNLLT